MLEKVNVHRAKTCFSRLLARVERGEEIIIARAGKPVARLTQVIERPRHRTPGSAKGKVVIVRDFDAPLPASLRKAFGA